MGRVKSPPLIPLSDEFLGRDVDADPHWTMKMFTNTKTDIPPLPRITRLPYEILREIFTVLVCALVDNPVRLLLVCKYWSEVATSTHVLWSNIIVGSMVSPLQLEEIWDEMPRMVRCTTVSALVRAINRTGRSKFRLTICELKNGTWDDEPISNEDDQSAYSENDQLTSLEDSQNSFALADPTCFETRCHSLRLMTLKLPRIIRLHRNKLSALEELTIPDTIHKRGPIGADFLQNLAYNSPKLRVLRCANPSYLPEYEVILARLRCVHASDDWIAEIGKSRAVEKEKEPRNNKGHTLPAYPFIFNPKLDDLGLYIDRAYEKPGTLRTIQPEMPSVPTPRKLTLSRAYFAQNADLYDRLTHLTLRRCWATYTYGGTHEIMLPCLTHLRLAGCKYVLGHVLAPNLYSLQIYDGIRKGAGFWPGSISVRPRLLDIHWNDLDQRLMRLLQCEWKDITRLTLVLQTSKTKPHKSLKEFVDDLIHNPDRPHATRSRIPKPSHPTQLSDSSLEDQSNNIMCPHLEYFTVLSLNPRLSAKDINILQRAAQVQAKRVSVARKDNGVFKGARIGWHSSFKFQSHQYDISQTEEWGMKWKEII